MGIKVGLLLEREGIVWAIVRLAAIVNRVVEMVEMRIAEEGEHGGKESKQSDF